MPFIPHTQDDVSRMLAARKLDSVQQLFDEVPEKPTGPRAEYP